MGQLAREFGEVASVLVRRGQAPEQAGIFAGVNPADYNPNDPIQLWVIQLIIILAMTQFLAFFLGKIKQPRVIAEVIGGVLLGPTVMGRIPGFTSSIFPTLSLTLINLTATIGLVFFLFLVGLEIDTKIIRKNAKTSMLISAVGLVIPLGLGAALGVPLYHQFVDPSVNYGYFLLFVAVAIGITAFPVLCRILTALKLLDDPVGAITLAAGVGNDVVGWVLLALTVALVNASSGVTAVYILLTGFGYTLFLLIPVRWAYRWLAHRTGCLEAGTPSALMMTLTLVLVLFSAFFTDIIGIHPIFGGFLAGLVIPHENGYAIAIVEKLEDFVVLLFLPLYFAQSGLKTNLGLLDNGITWGYTILICVVAFFSKFLGCSITAFLCGFNWRESGAIGSLMSCKGLVELIVLNVGLSAGILDTRTFSMFVLHALVLTFMTTPLTLLFYPVRYRARALGAGVGGTGHAEAGGEVVFVEKEVKTRFTVVLEKVEQLPAAMTFTQLLQSSAPPSEAEHGHVSTPAAASARSVSEKSSAGDEKAPAPATTTVNAPGLPFISSSHRATTTQITIDALRIIELTERTSAVLKSQSAESLTHTDAVLSVFRTFGYLNGIRVRGALDVVGWDEFAGHVRGHVRAVGSEMVILPWNASSSSSSSSTAEGGGGGVEGEMSPFDALFGGRGAGGGGGGGAQNASAAQTQFFRRMFAESPVDVALFLDRGVPASLANLTGDISTHIVLPFFGGPDDRLALAFVAQLCSNTRAGTSATVVRVTRVDVDVDVDGEELSPVNSIVDAKVDHGHVSVTFPDTVYAQRDTQTRLASDTADNLIWDRYSSGSAPEVASARMTFTHESASRPLHAALSAAARAFTEHKGARPMVVVGRSRRLAVDAHSAELREVLAERNASVTMGSDLVKALGDLGTAIVAEDAGASLLVLQAAPGS